MKRSELLLFSFLTEHCQHVRSEAALVQNVQISGHIFREKYENSRHRSAVEGAVTERLGVNGGLWNQDGSL